ncbi:peptidase inhibitor family I36 protein [Streptomyces regalis]|uniref:Uncharacterized protein n=1 Tax=Streptomyces regalis TaxID=68262 RepID=A0A0X3V0R8_9ACTN|nr:peptidase inhibitor family I36 protein [Streptomyces regalis]KUL38304.1 hypothetical protein ADL12_17065 [Streptomyces regalis]
MPAAPPPCNAGEICLFPENDYQGTPRRWTPQSGYVNLPPYLHDTVGSFIANAPGCFIDRDPAEFRKVAVGDYSAVHKADDKFGSRIDALNAYGHCPP